MKSVFRLPALFLVTLTSMSLMAQMSEGQSRHDQEFWKVIAKNDYAAPAGTSVDELARELSGYLGSEDPEMRDEIAYSVLTNWIYTKRTLSAETISSLADEWMNNLRDIPGSGANPVLRRSFSALMLSVVAARDNAEPVLSEPQHRKFFDSALRYLAAEPDLRGYDDKLGWIHSAAHTADLLKFLSRSPQMTRADQAAVLAAVLRKMREAPVVFTHGEDERYARALLSIIKRKDVDADSFKTWAAGAKPAFPTGANLNEKSLCGYQNGKNLLAKLSVLLSAESADVAWANDAVRRSLKDSF